MNPGKCAMEPLLQAFPEPVGDTAVSLQVSRGAAAETAERVRGLAHMVVAAGISGVLDVVGAPGRVTVAYDPLEITDMERFRAAVAAAAVGAPVGLASEATRHEIAVAYDGPDLAEVASSHALGREALIAAHTGPDYLVEAIGFLPGFAYLAGLATSLATPRRATPRRRVPAGAVGIGGGQTGIYPCASPGGWNLIGRTTTTLFDPARPRPALLGVGDRVRFVPADLPPTDTARNAAPAPNARRPGITVIDPGLFTTVQDRGRPGHRASGVPLSGAADAVSLRLANLLVGNPEDAAGLECTLLGPTLRFERAAVIAVVGGVFPGLESGVAIRVAAGTVVALGHATSGCRGYLAVAGGIDVPSVMGSRSTLVAAGLGGLAGRPLAKGDGLAVGEPVRAVKTNASLAALPWPPAQPGQPHELRVIPGEHAEAFGTGAWSRVYRTSSRSDRMGVRFDCDPLPVPAAAAGMPSVAVFPGTVQVPPDGRPILLLADAQTIGGYPICAHVIAADLPIAAQLRPGDTVTWRPVSLAEAHAALREQEAAMAAFGRVAR